MKTIYLNALTSQLSPCAATIGFFDGVHLGHQYLIERFVNDAHARQLEATLITFDRHPREVLNKEYRPLLLNTLDEKLGLLAKTKIDNCVVLSFDTQMASLSAREFMQMVLVDKLNVRMLAMGYDNRFGHKANETFDDYVAYGRELGIDVVRNDAYAIDAGNVNVSSSVIRSLLEGGEVAMASSCLNYPYIIQGKVVHGNNIGTGIGFPTANIQPSDANKLIPATGVYAVKVMLMDDSVVRYGMMNIGCCPTFSSTIAGEVIKTTLEVHIFDYNGDLYGKQIAVSFVGRLRDEKKYRSTAELINQLKRDKEEAVNLFPELRNA